MTVRLYSTTDLRKVVDKLQRLNVTKLSIVSIENELLDAECDLTPNAPEMTVGDSSIPPAKDTKIIPCILCKGNKQLLVEGEWKDCTWCNGSGSAVYASTTRDQKENR